MHPVAMFSGCCWQVRWPHRFHSEQLPPSRATPTPDGGSLAGLPDWTPLTTALDRALDNVFAVDLCKYEDKYFIYNLAAVDGGDLSRHLPKPRGSVSGASRPALSFAARTENVRMRRRAALDALADANCPRTHAADQRSRPHHVSLLPRRRQERLCMADGSLGPAPQCLRRIPRFEDRHLQRE